MEHLTRIQKIAARLFAMFLMVILVTESGEFSEVFTYARTLKINAVAKESKTNSYENIVLVQSGQKSGSVTLDWTEENAEFCGKFNVYRDGEIIKETKETVFCDDTLQVNTNYVYYVEAVDKDENIISKSNELSVTTREDKVLTDRWTLKDDAEVGDLTLQEDVSLDLNGHTLTVYGTFIAEDGCIKIDEGQLICYGNAEFGKDAYIHMYYESDYFFIGGDFICDSYSNCGKNWDDSIDYSRDLESGTIEVHGDFSNTDEEHPFYLNNDVNVILSGKKRQDVSLANNKGKLENLVLKNTSDEGVVFHGYIPVGKLEKNFSKVSVIDNSGEIIDGIYGWKLEKDQVIDGDLTLLCDELDLNGHKLTVSGNLTQLGGTINVNGGTLDIKGNYRIQTPSQTESGLEYNPSSGILKMNNKDDKVYIRGDFFNSGINSSEDCLTDGTMYVSGDFTNEIVMDSNNFMATDNHTVVFNGDTKQNIASYQETKSWSQKGIGFKNVDFVNKSDKGINIEDGLLVVAAGNIDSHGKFISGILGVDYDTTFAGNSYNGNLKAWNTWCLEEDFVLNDLIQLIY